MKGKVTCKVISYGNAGTSTPIRRSVVEYTTGCGIEIQNMLYNINNNNKQQTTNNKHQTPNNKPQTTNNKQQKQQKQKQQQGPKSAMTVCPPRASARIAAAALPWGSRIWLCTTNNKKGAFCGVEWCMGVATLYHLGIKNMGPGGQTQHVPLRPQKSFWVYRTPSSDPGRSLLNHQPDELQGMAPILVPKLSKLKFAVGSQYFRKDALD